MNFKDDVNKLVKQQETLLKIIDIENGLEKEERKDMLKLNSFIHVFCIIFLIYIGFLDDFFADPLSLIMIL